MNQSEQDFAEEYARQALVKWADYALRNGGVLPHYLPDQVVGVMASMMASLEMFPPYVAVALDKGWISKATPHRVLAKGYSTAAAFLRR